MNIWNDRPWTPMLLKEVDKPFNSKNHLFELKFDGHRTVIFATPKKVTVYSRNQKDVTYLFPELEKIKNLVKNKTIFDGEIVKFHQGKPSFSKLQERTHLKDKQKIKKESITNPIIFICFDILYDNKDLTKLPLIERKEILNKFNDNDVFLKNTYIVEKGIELFKYVKKQELEGIIAKEKKGLYEINTRSNTWLKIKNLHREKFLIGGFIKSTKTETLSLLLGEYRHNEFFFVGKVSLHENHPLWQKIQKQPISNTSPFKDYNEKGNFLKPQMECQVEYLERTKNNHLRQPIFKGNI